MIKFFKRYKYTSLVVGALVIVLVSGAGGAFAQRIALKDDLCRVCNSSQSGELLEGAIFPQE